MKKEFGNLITALLVAGVVGLFSLSLATKGQESRNPSGNAAPAQTPTPVPTATPTPSPSPSPSATATPVPEPEPVPTATATPALRTTEQL
jgi:hypothetical protein